MKRIILFLALLVACVAMNASPVKPKGTVILPTDINIRYTGRININDPFRPMFVYPSAQIEAIFTGTSLRMMAKPGSGYFMAEIDKAEPFKVSFMGRQDSIVQLATALPEGEHHVKITYIIEGYQLRAEFWGFILDEGGALVRLPEPPDRRIEFIGNSITCGYGNENDDKNEHYSYDSENHYYSYAALTARALGAEYQAVCRSGIGIYRNYDGPETGNEDCMPAEYPYTCYHDKSQLWDFSRFTPQVVCLNLGTNDTSTGIADQARLESAYYDFLKTLREHYPKAKIVLLTGSMLNGEELNIVKQALDNTRNRALKAGDKEVYRFDMTPQTGSLGYGADWHPSLAQHEQMARELTSYLQKLMGW